MKSCPDETESVTGPPALRLGSGQEGGRYTLRALDGEGDGVAAAGAERGDSALQVAELQFVEQRDEKAGAGCANGMAKRDGAPVHVHFLGIELELPRDGDGGHGEGFV